jgi:hypothetical protein
MTVEIQHKLPFFSEKLLQQPVETGGGPAN